MCFAPSRCKKVLQDWVGSAPNLILTIWAATFNPGGCIMDSVWKYTEGSVGTSQHGTSVVPQHTAVREGSSVCRGSSTSSAIRRINLTSACPRIRSVPTILTTNLSGDSTKKGCCGLLHSICAGYEIIGIKYGLLQSVRKQRQVNLHAQLIGQQSVNESSILQTCYDEIQAAAEEHSVDYLALCILLGGETTTVVQSTLTDNTEKSIGGRCSHMALAATLRWYEMMRESDSQPADYRHEVTLLAGATDGLDGPAVGGAGVWVNSQGEPVLTNERLFKDALSSLERSDSYGFFLKHAPSCVIPPRLTGTNVMDIFISTAGIYL
ncbi:unnamed protein product [Echinostoma caproni]|uniref:MOFRL domain-containing protein n=1 Tax=Echinostoma caproni TaxID=27848 RepID=A0A183AMP4_9TREM|nr:unnamed protein product [Echinostoma caproni]